MSVPAFLNAGPNTGQLAALRASLAKAELKAKKQARVPLGVSRADACLQGGLRRGVVHEIFAEGGHEATATGFAAVLAFHVAAKKPVLWIRQDFSALEFGELAATGLLELGLDPKRLLVLRVMDIAAGLRAGHEALSCAALGAVVMESIGLSKALNLVASQRLTLASAETGVTAFLLRFNAPSHTSAAETRWLIRAARSMPPDEHWGAPAFDAHLARNRHGRTGQFVLQWRCDDGLFHEPPIAPRVAAPFGAVVSASFDRSPATALESASECF